MEMPEERFSCHKCSEELVFEVKIGRRDMCPNCNAYLHCCFNCSFWDANVHNQCTENQGEFIRDREVGIFCLYFTFKPIAEDRTSEAVSAKDQLDALFKGRKFKKGKGDGPSLSIGLSAQEREDEALSKLDDLFKK